jgi:hypothetical protein
MLIGSKFTVTAITTIGTLDCLGRSSSCKRRAMKARKRFEAIEVFEGIEVCNRERSVEMAAFYARRRCHSFYFLDSRFSTERVE